MADPATRNPRKNNLSPPAKAALSLSRLAHRGRRRSRRSDDGAGRVRRQRALGGAPGGAGPTRLGRAPRQRRSPVTGISPWVRWRIARSAPAGHVGLLVEGSRSAAPWRLPALHPLISRGEGKQGYGPPRRPENKERDKRSIGDFLSVIPWAREASDPGIHNHDRCGHGPTGSMDRKSCLPRL
jgi:hypothetical protein